MFEYIPRKGTTILIRTLVGDNHKNIGFRGFRKCGVTELRKLKLPNTMLLEQFYLSHKPTTIAGRHYVGADLTAQDEAIEKLEEVFAPILTINKERAVDGVRPSPIQMAEMLRNMADADAEKVWKALQQVTHKE